MRQRSNWNWVHQQEGAVLCLTGDGLDAVAVGGRLAHATTFDSG